MVAQQFKDNEIIKGLVSGPWLAISSMISNGNWEVKDGKSLHPNHHFRHVTHTGVAATQRP
jgi:hypothetical protein